MSKAKRKICVVTGTRAEYGLLYWLMRDIAADPGLTLQVVVTGAHLSAAFGSTEKVVAKDFAIDARVDMEIGDDSAVGVTNSLGKGIQGFAEAFARLQPDLIVVLGDRYEILGAAQAALIARIPLAHIHGGEITEGAFDNSIRHAVTKMAHFHFTSAKENSRRVIQMGEEPGRVFSVGAIGLDNIARLDLLDRAELERELGFSLESPCFAVTYHPVTLGEDSAEKTFRELLRALEKFPQAKIVFTKPNADTGNKAIADLIDAFVAKHPGQARAFTSLGQLKYLSLLRAVDCVIGNSSSGILEAPSLKVPTVDIGDRQKGRLAAKSVLRAAEKASDIEKKIKKALSPAFRRLAKKVKSPYHGKNISGRIKAKLKSLPLNNVLMKKFHETGK